MPKLRVVGARPAEIYVPPPKPEAPKLPDPYTPVELVVIDAVAAPLLTIEEVCQLPRHPRKHTRDDTMVYFLFNGNQYIYVGRALSQKDRHAQGDYKFSWDSWACVRCDPTQRFVLEQRYIEFHQPLCNIMGKDGNSVFSMSRMPLYLPTARYSPPMHPSDVPSNPFAPAPRVSLDERLRYAIANVESTGELTRMLTEALCQAIGEFADREHWGYKLHSPDQPTEIKFRIRGEPFQVTIDSSYRKRFAWNYTTPEVVFTMESENA